MNNAVSQGRFAMINVGNNRKVSYFFHRKSIFKKIKAQNAPLLKCDFTLLNISF